MIQKIIAQDSKHIIARAIIIFGLFGYAVENLVSDNAGGGGVGVIKHLIRFPYLMTAAAQLYKPLTHSITYSHLMRYNHPRGIVNEDCATKILRISEHNNHQL